MIRSMTGFYQVETSLGEVVCQAEIRSVNSRFLDLKINLPRNLAKMEEPLKKEVKKRISRGKVDLFISLPNSNGQGDALKLDEKILQSFKSLLIQVDQGLERKVEADLASLLQIKGLFSYQQLEIDPKLIESALLEVAAKASEGLVEMRQIEGANLAKEIQAHLDRLDELVREVTSMQDEIRKHFMQKLKANLAEVNIQASEADPRIIQEIGILIDKSDVTEELERFGSHIAQFRQLVTANEPVGRKLDFLLQELNREANTLCSKSPLAKLTACGVELKCSIEKIREQTQNIE